MLRPTNGFANEGSAALARRCARHFLAVAPRLLGSLRGGIAAKAVSGLSLPRFRLLAYLTHHPDSSLSEVAEDLGTGLPTLSVSLDRLEQAGFINRRSDACDRRRTVLRLTRRGSAVFVRTEAALARHLAMRLRLLPDDDLRIVADGLDRLSRVPDVVTSPPRSDQP
jgi:DNA-binding MarR family transcriptional regulator